ncbi:MAG TPA: VanZ family protein [Chitinivibrionales bacterium]|nr:VanZ family protein [Chitinivibrionales bacterium]
MNRDVRRTIRLQKSAAILLACTVFVMLAVGLNPRGYRLFNKVELAAGGKGMRFSQSGMVFSKEKWPFGRPEVSDSTFTVLMNLTPSRFCDCATARIISFCDTANNEKVAVGQYNHRFIILSNHNGIKKNLYCDSIFFLQNETTISITGNPRGTELCADGTRRKIVQGFIIDGRDILHPGRIVIGNSPDGTGSWEGTMKKIMIFRDAFLPEVVPGGKGCASTRRPEIPAYSETGIASYDFSLEKDFRVANLFGKGNGLFVPKFFTPLKLNILTLPDMEHVWAKGSLQDTAVNFFGFIPFGFILSLVLYLKKRDRIFATLLTTGIGFLFSLFIELAQVYIPTRSSQLSDLFLNTVGALAGAYIMGVIFKNRLQND